MGYLQLGHDHIVNGGAVITFLILTHNNPAAPEANLGVNGFHAPGANASGGVVERALSIGDSR